MASLIGYDNLSSLLKTKMEVQKSDPTLASAIDVVQETLDESAAKINKNKELVLEKQHHRGGMISPPIRLSR